MSSSTHPQQPPRPRSPWTGSAHVARHRWQLDGATSLSDVTRIVTALVTELTAAHSAGWWLLEPMRGGHLIAARASRRQRGQQRERQDTAPTMRGDAARRPAPPWRLRLVDEPGAPGFDAYDATAAFATPVLEQTGHSLHQVSGPPLEPHVLSHVVRQVTTTGLPRGLWGVAPARVGPNLDLVAHGSALRLHAVRDGVLVRTCEALTFQHAADGAGNLAQAAASYALLARSAAQMAAAGGLLVSSDDGLVEVGYGAGPPAILAQKPIGSPA